MNLTFLIVGLLSSCSQPPVSIEEADKLYFQMKPAEAYQMYEQIWSDSSHSEKDRAESARKLATMAWLINDKPDQAYDILRDLEEFDYEKSKGYAVWSRVLSEEGQHEKAIEMAKQAITTSESVSQTYSGQARLGIAVLEKYKESILNGTWKKEYSFSEDLVNTQATIQAIMAESPGDISLSKLHLALSLLVDKHEEAYQGWLSFYRADDKGNVHSTQEGPKSLLSSGLLRTGSITENQAKSIVDGLAKSGFIEYAVLALKLHEGSVSFKEPRFQDLLNYYQTLQNIEEHTVTFYRTNAAGDSDKDSYDNAMRSEASSLWDKLNWEGEKPEFDQRKFMMEMRKRFGMVARLMTANGHYGLSLGHVVLDENREVSQYDKQGTLRYIAIDHMLSNGYSSWFWDGRAEIGGWAPDGSSILQVRSAYSDGPVNAWMGVSDPVEVADTREEIMKNQSSDDAIAKEDPYAYLPGLSKRLRFNIGMELLEELKSQGLEGSQLRAAFINTTENLALESSIFAHEGRHAIDKKYSGDLSTEELEYRAKLSEIYFSSKPFLAVNAVLGPNNGDGTSHGDSNRRVVKGIVKWMKKNKSDIKDLDLNRPMLPQLDQLTEEQLKVAVNSLDPLAK